MKKIIAASTALVLAFGVAACDGANENAMEDAGEQNAEAVNAEAEAMEDAGQITDAEADVMEEQADRVEDAAEGDTDMGTNDEPIGETVDESTM